MPYIEPEHRGHATERLGHAGHLNYAMTRVIDDYIGATGLSYAVINYVLGALAAATQELLDPPKLVDCRPTLIGIARLFHDLLARYHAAHRNHEEVLGVARAVELEFYRRVAEPYENLKIEQNGDVYTNAVRALHAHRAEAS